MMTLRTTLLFGLVLLAGCATPAQRIATKLDEYGVPPRQAQCMGDRLQSRLSLSQLSRLDDIVRVNGNRIGRMSIIDIANALNDPRDPALVAEVIRAGLDCAF